MDTIWDKNQLLNNAFYRERGFDCAPVGTAGYLLRMDKLPAVALLCLTIVVLVVVGVFVIRSKNKKIGQLDRVCGEESRRLNQYYEYCYAHFSNDYVRMQQSYESQIDAMKETFNCFIDVFDRKSRRSILAACAEIGLDGVLLTNVFFLDRTGSPSSPVYRQIDHVLVTPRGMAIVENKNWNGLVLADQMPGNLCSAFRFVLNQAVPDLQSHDWTRNPIVLRSKPGLIEIDTERTGPNKQSRRQAKFLSAYLSERGFSIPFIETVVYYSGSADSAKVYAHSDVELRTRVARCTDELPRAIRALRLARAGQAAGLASLLDVAAVVASLTGDFADVTGVGKFSGQFPDFLP